MFDMGFAELLLIAIIGLIVIGPKRMPEAVRVLGYWLGRLRRSVQSARKDMEREFGLDEIRRDLHNEALLADLEKERKVVQDSLSLAAPATSNTEIKAETEQEMLQAFDEFDEEFGLDADNESTGSSKSTGETSVDSGKVKKTSASEKS